MAKGGVLENLIRHNLDELFPGMRFDSCRLFPVTCNANTEPYVEVADDLVAMIRSAHPVVHHRLHGSRSIFQVLSWGGSGTVLCYCDAGGAASH